MFRHIDASSDRFLNALATLNDRIERAQREVTSGRKLRDSSDDPDEVSRLLAVRANLARLEQTQTNLGRVKTEVDTAEGSVQTAVKLFDRVRTLGMIGANGNQTAQTRQTLADELSGILERMVGLANTQADGRYVFSGDSDQQAAYSYDEGQTPAWSGFLGTASTRQTVHPTGVPFAVAKTAQEIFDSTDTGLNVYQAIDNLRGAMASNDEAGTQAALEPLAAVSGHLNQMLSFYGNAQSEITESTDTAAKTKLQFQTQLADIEDADITSAIVELQQLRFQQQAALQVRGQTPRKSLFDVL